MKESEYKVFFVSFTIQGVDKKLTYRVNHENCRMLRNVLCNQNKEKMIMLNPLIFETSDDLTVIINPCFIVYVNFLWEPLKDHSDVDAPDLEPEQLRIFVGGENKPLTIGIGDKSDFCNFMNVLTSYRELNGFSFFKDADEEDVSFNLSMLKVLEVGTTFYAECEAAFADAHTPILDD